MIIIHYLNIISIAHEEITVYAVDELAQRLPFCTQSKM